MKSLALAVLHVERSPETLPLGAGCVLACLRSDPRLSGSLKSFIVEDEVAVDAEDFALALLGKAVDFVGFSLFSWNRRKVAEVCAILRKRKPTLVLFAGGPEATADAENLASAEIFDFIVAGEGESVVADAVFTLLSGDGMPARILKGGPRADGGPHGVESLISPWLSGALNPRAYDGGVLWELSRGCPFTCAYCFEGKGEKGVRHFPAARLEAELELFVRSGVSQIFVLDPTFNISKSRTVELLRLFRAKAPDMHWKFELRAELIDREEAKLFGRLDCSVQIGLQSVRPEVLARVNRSIDRKDFRRRLAMLDAAGVPFGLDLIYGLPGDRLEGFCESLDFALSLGPNHLDIFPLAILPGTELADRAGEYGLALSPEAPHLVLSAPDFSRSDMERAAELARACSVFYSRGRAVPWFGQACAALGMRPSALLGDFADLLKGLGRRPVEFLKPAEIEDSQVDFLSGLFMSRGKERLMPAMTDLVRLNGAWSRALAEGGNTDLVLNYDPDLILGPASLDLARFVAEFPPDRTALSLGPGPEGPELRRRKAATATRTVNAMKTPKAPRPESPSRPGPGSLPGTSDRVQSQSRRRR